MSRSVAARSYTRLPCAANAHRQQLGQEVETVSPAGMTDGNAFGQRTSKRLGIASHQHLAHFVTMPALLFFDSV
jgi:hypothetical protein